MTIKEVMVRYQKKVPFPLSYKKIRAAGYNPKKYLKDISDAIKSCEDYDGTPRLLQ